MICLFARRRGKQVMEELRAGDGYKVQGDGNGKTSMFVDVM